MSLDLRFPKTIDINPTAKCNLRCTFCWGPDHNLADSLSTNDWQDVISFFHERGTTGVVFTGGEPLLRADLPLLAHHAKSLDMSVTLSTNALLLAKRGDAVLEYCDEVGLPLDGSTVESNAKMRLGSIEAYQAVISGAAHIRRHYPSINITIRTVASRVNAGDIVSIASKLASLRELYDRWKLYQFSASSIGLANRAEHELGDAAFIALHRQISREFPGLPFTAYPTERRTGRYLFVGPTGEIFGVTGKADYEYRANVKSSTTEEIIQAVHELVEPEVNALHGVA